MKSLLSTGVTRRDAIPIAVGPLPSFTLHPCMHASNPCRRVEPLNIRQPVGAHAKSKLRFAREHWVRVFEKKQACDAW